MTRPRRQAARPGIYRDPPAETEDYPGLTVCDERVTGSINVRDSRLSLWAFIGTAVAHGWDEAEHGWSPARHGYTADEAAEFLGNLLEMRGEFGRLLCILADVERREDARGFNGPAWWQQKTARKRVIRQLRRCLAALEAEAP